MTRNPHDPRKRHLACFTIVQDESFFLSRWLKHYTGQTGMCREDLYVLYHPTRHPVPEPELDRARGIIRGGFANVVPVHHTVAFDHDWLRGVVADFCTFLLKSYHWVLFSEVDEWLLPDPRAARIWGHLSSFLAYCPELADVEYVRANGYEVVHQPGEPPLDCAAGRLLSQRQWWYRSEIYSKTLITRIPLRWHRGFHSLAGPPAGPCDPEPHPDLLLVHLHKVDRDLARQRNESARDRNWSPADLAEDRGWQNRALGKDLDRYFDTNIDTGRPLTTLEPIPDELRAIC